MRTKLLMSLAVLGLMCGPALALDGPGKGGGKNKLAFLTVTNNCDAGVRIELTSGNSTGQYWVLEPFAQQTFFMSIKGKKDTVNVTAILTDDNSITTSHTCKLEQNLVTNATVTCSTSTSPPTLSIDCLAPGEVPVASLDSGHEEEVLAGSFGGLTLLLMFGSVLGRAPRCREQEQIDESLSGSAELKYC